MLMVDVGRRIAGDLGQMFRELSESPEALEQVNAAVSGLLGGAKPPNPAGGA